LGQSCGRACGIGTARLIALHRLVGSRQGVKLSS